MRNLFALNDTGLGLMSQRPDHVRRERDDREHRAGQGDGRRRSPRGVLSAPGNGTLTAHGRTTERLRTAARCRGAVWTRDGRGNYWSDYRGYDADGDGVGDRPYPPSRRSPGRLDDNETLRLFRYTLAQQAIDTAADMFPVYRVRCRHRRHRGR